MDIALKEPFSFEHFFTKHGKNIFYTALVLCFGLLGIYYFFIKPNESDLYTYLDAKVQVERLISKDPEAYTRIQTLFKSHKDLAREYGLVVAKQLTLMGKWQDAKALIQPTLFQEETPYHRYSQISWLIAEKDYSQALTLAKELQSSLEEQENLRLFAAHNLLRIALLCKALEMNENEAWQNWHHFADNPANAATMNAMKSLFLDGRCEFKDFLTYQMSGIN